MSLVEEVFRRRKAHGVFGENYHFVKNTECVPRKNTEAEKSINLSWSQMT
jgi:hypothetical protein